MPKLAIFYQQIIPLIPSLKKNYFNPMNMFDEIHLFTFDRELTEDQRTAIRPSFGKANVTFHPFGGVNLHNLYFIRRRLAKTLAQLKPDVIRAFSSLTDGYLATYCGLKNGIPAVISVHGDKDRDNRYNILREKKYGKYIASLVHRATLEKPSLRRAAHIIAVYDFAAEYAKRYSKAPITVIYNKVDTDVFSPGPARDDNTFRIINVGRFIPGKNQELLIRAMKDIDGQLILVGDGETLSDLKALAQELGIANKIVWHKSINNTDLVRYFRSADVYATAIRMGGIAIPVLEAMACGLPVVQCPPPYGEYPEFIGKAGLVVEDTPEGFAKGINSLKADVQLRKKMGAFARRKMQAHNSNEMERLETNVYRAVIRK